MSVCYVCVYVCTYIVHMNVAMYVCNPSDTTDTNFYLKAQQDGTKVFKQPHKKMLMSSLIWNKEYSDFVCLTSKGEHCHMNLVYMIRRFVKDL